ncbi:MAG: hypothetical protein II837_10170 [Treponema sp.]|nr:hypothetical protein [Treponema sp.]MBQ7167429.1 hypothetical protein [Treponema sp.]
MAADGRKKRGFIKLPQTKYRKEENVLLAVGLVLVLTGLFVFVGKHEASVRLFAFRPLICLAFGILLLFTSLAFTGSSLSLFFGLFFLQMGAVLLIMDSGILPCGFSQMWPTIMIAAAFSLFPAGLYKARRVRTVYLFPAIMMLLLGIIFLLFSLHVFPVSFREFVARCWPLLIMLSGGGLVVIFFVQQLNAKDFPYMEDDSLVDGDEK